MVVATLQICSNNGAVVVALLPNSAVDAMPQNGKAVVAPHFL